MDCLRNIAPEIDLHPSQNAGVLMGLLHKKALLSHDTGMGKSYMYAVLVRGLVNAYPNSKHIIVMVHDSLKQLPDDIASIAHVPVAAIDATSVSAKHFDQLLLQNTVICMTYDAFMNEHMMSILFYCINRITSFSLDEAHHAANWNSSNRSFMLRAMAQYTPYNFGLTATPFIVSSQQFYRLMNLVDRSLSFRRDETRQGKYAERYLPVNREDYKIKGKYKTTVIPVQPQLNQLGKQDGVVFTKIKGPGAYNQVNALIKATKTRLNVGKKIIVYIAHHEVREWVESNFQQVGIPYVAINGRITNQNERTARMMRFLDGEVNVMVTSITESLNMSADVIIFYEFDVRMKQVIGRGHRGLQGKELEIVLIATENTAEIDFFEEKVVDRAKQAQALVHKDYSEIIDLGNQVKTLSIDEDDLPF